MGGQSEEKTLPASQKKLLEARKKGQVPRSKDFTSGAALAGAAGVLLLTGPGAAVRLTALLDTAATAAARPSGWEDELRAVVSMVVLSTLVALRGIPLAMDPITPKLSHINPAEGFQRLFKMRALVELVKSVIKVLLIGAILATLLVGGLRAIVLAPGCGLSCVQVTFTAQLTGLLEAAGVLSLMVGLADIGVQRWLFMRDQKMSVSEAKRERKDQDGNPIIMGHRRRLRQEEAATPSGQALGIARATILITDGWTVAVGLRFVMSEALAPERLALNAVDVSNQADAARAAGEPRAQVLDNRARRAAAAVLRMAQDGAPAGDPGSQHRLRAVVNALGPQGAGEFARTAQAFYPQTVATVLGAVNAGPDTAAAGAFTRSAFLALHEQDYANAPGLATSMGAALGRVWNPTDPVAASRDAGRMGAILNTPQGRSLLAQPDGVGQFLDRREELALVWRTPGITAQSLDATDDVWQALVHSTAPGRDGPRSQAAAR